MVVVVFNFFKPITHNFFQIILLKFLAFLVTTHINLRAYREEGLFCEEFKIGPV